MAGRILAVAAVLLAAAACRADDWPCFRGPSRNGISAETGWSAASPKTMKHESKGSSCNWMTVTSSASERATP